MNFSHFKYGLRFLSKNKSHTAINIIGFAIGICVFLLISLYVLHENNFDKFNERYEQKARLEFGGEPILPAGIGHLLANSIPEIEKTCRTSNLGQATISYTPNDENKLSRNLNIYIRQFVDSTFFDIFTLEFVYGNPTNALTEPMSIILSDKVSKKLFGDGNPVNKIVKVRNTSYRIDAVVKQPENSHFKFDALFSLYTMSESNGKEYLTNLKSHNYLTYILFNGDYNLNDLSNKIYNYLDDYDNNIFVRYGTNEHQDESYVSLRPFSEIYFHKDDEIITMFAGLRHGDKQLVNLFLVIAIFILLIAIINFINLSTAKASTRIKEISVKKIVGAQKGKLRFQFIFESITITTLAMFIALTLLQIILPEFNNYFSKDISLANILNDKGLAALVGFTLITGIISGLYPAIYLSQTSISKLLNDSKNKKSASFLFRRILIFFQFTITSSLIAGTLIVTQQNNYLNNKDLGFEKDNIINLQLPRKIIDASELFKAKLFEQTFIKDVSISHGIPGNTNNTMTFNWRDTKVTMRVTSVDPNFFDLYKIQLKEGRFFDKNLQTDRINTCIINETAAKLLGWDKFVGEYNTVNNPRHMAPDHFTIIGIIKDYHVESLHNPIVPMAIFWNKQYHRQASIKFSGNDIQKTISHIENTWKSFAPDSPFEYSILSSQLDEMYAKEKQMHTVVSYFSILIIFIACLGLFGLASFMVLQKTKEIGIRKVYGASSANIILRLCKEYSILIIISSIISIPFVIYLLDIWLSEYSYRINIKWWVFVVSAILSLLIANITVYFQSIKAANKNPIEAIRHE